MTTRSAILLNCPGDGKNFLQGVAKDIESYKKHLLSDSGGNWLESEIDTITDPTASALLARLKLENTKDILYILFCGHGYYAKPADQQMLCLSVNEEIAASNLLAYGKRVLLITDSCQEVITTTIIESNMKAFRERHMDSGSKNRKRFDDIISNIPVGAGYHARACDIGELAGEDKSGGIFTQALLEECKSRSAFKLDFNLCNNFNAVEKRVSTKTGGRQNPQLTRPRSSNAMTFVFGMS